MKARFLATVLPFVFPVGFTVFAIVIAYRMTEGALSDREILVYTFYLITGVLGAMLVELMSARLSARAASSEIFENLVRFQEIRESGIEDPDLGKQRVEKAISRTLRAEFSVFKCGIAFSSLLAPENKEMWKEVLSVRSVKILIIDPDWLVANQLILEKLTEHLVRDREVLPSQIRSSIAILRNIWAEVPAGYRERLEVRLYRRFPTLNFDVTDEGKPSAKMMVELLPYTSGLRNRPHLILKPSPSGWYESLLATLRRQWDDAIPLSLVSP